MGFNSDLVMLNFQNRLKKAIKGAQSVNMDAPDRLTQGIALGLSDAMNLLTNCIEEERERCLRTRN